MSVLSLKIVTETLVLPKAFLLCNWDIRFYVSCGVVGLSRIEFSKRFLRKLVIFFLEIGIYKLGQILRE